MNRLTYGQVLALITMVLLVPAAVQAQTGRSSVTVKGTVSEVVTLSIPPNSTHGDVDVNVVSSGGTVRLTLSGAKAGSSVIRVPLMVRSNTGFRISATFESNTAQLTKLSVLDVQANGALVSREAVNNLEITKHLDLRGKTESTSPENASSVLDVSGPFVVLSGPRVSTGGTLNSSNNALQVTLLIRVKPESVGSWLAHLTFFNN
jgi:hypothetical protein